MSVCLCLSRQCVRACVRACVRVRVRACVRARVRVRVLTAGGGAGARGASAVIRRDSPPLELDLRVHL